MKITKKGKTQAYQCLDGNDPLPDLIQRTNRYLLDLRLAKWKTQKHYEQLCIKPNEAELAHKYGTSLRPLFNEMAIETTVNSGIELVKLLIDFTGYDRCS